MRILTAVLAIGSMCFLGLIVHGMYVLTVQNRPHEPAIIDICPDVFPEPVTPTPEPPLIDPEPTPEPVKPAKTCHCSPLCVCGCNDGKPCQCSKPPVPLSKDTHTSGGLLPTVQSWVQVTEQVQVCNGGQCQVVTRTRWVKR